MTSSFDSLLMSARSFKAVRAKEAFVSPYADRLRSVSSYRSTVTLAAARREGALRPATHSLSLHPRVALHASAPDATLQQQQQQQQPRDTSPPPATVHASLSSDQLTGAKPGLPLRLFSHTRSPSAGQVTDTLTEGAGTVGAVGEGEGSGSRAGASQPMAAAVPSAELLISSSPPTQQPSLSSPEITLAQSRSQEHLLRSGKIPASLSSDCVGSRSEKVTRMGSRVTVSSRLLSSSTFRGAFSSSASFKTTAAPAGADSGELCPTAIPTSRSRMLSFVSPQRVTVRSPSMGGQVDVPAVAALDVAGAAAGERKGVARCASSSPLLKERVGLVRTGSWDAAAMAEPLDVRRALQLWGLDAEEDSGMAEQQGVDAEEDAARELRRGHSTGEDRPRLVRVMSEREDDDDMCCLWEELADDEDAGAAPGARVGLFNRRRSENGVRSSSGVSAVIRGVGSQSAAVLNKGGQMIANTPLARGGQMVVSNVVTIGGHVVNNPIAKGGQTVVSNVVSIGGHIVTHNPIAKGGQMVVSNVVNMGGQIVTNNPIAKGGQMVVNNMATIRGHVVNNPIAKGGQMAVSNVVSIGGHIVTKNPIAKGGHMVVSNVMAKGGQFVANNRIAKGGHMVVSNVVARGGQIVANNPLAKGGQMIKKAAGNMLRDDMSSVASKQPPRHSNRSQVRSMVSDDWDGVVE